MRTLQLLILSFLLASCTHALHQYQAGDVSSSPKGKIHRITATGEQNGFLGFRFNTDYVNVAWQNLQDQCRQGSVSDIHTRYSTSHRFFSWNNQVKMTANCSE